jgi:hypothetical protein
MTSLALSPPGLAAASALAARAWGTALEYVSITPAGHRAEMAIAGEDPWWMYAYSTMFASIREQRWAAVSDEVRRLTGCSPVPGPHNARQLQDGLTPRNTPYPSRRSARSVDPGRS